MTTRPPTIAEVASAVRQLRQGLRLNQVELAPELGVSQPTLSAIETGRSWPTVTFLRALHKRLPSVLQTSPAAEIVRTAVDHVPPVRSQTTDKPLVKVVVVLPPNAPQTAEMIEALSHLSLAEVCTLGDAEMAWFIRSYFTSSPVDASGISD